MENSQLTPTKPKADYESKTVMLRGETGDTVDVDGFGEFEIVQRTNTFFGPKLRLRSDDGGAMLTAPGPASELMLWFYHGEQLERQGEVSAELVDEKQYDICACGEPIKNSRHQQLALNKIGEHE